MKRHIFKARTVQELKNDLMWGKVWDYTKQEVGDEIAAPYLCEVEDYGNKTYHYNDVPMPFIAFDEAGTNDGTSRLNARTGVTDGTIYVNVYDTVTLTTDVDWITLSTTAVTEADTAFTYNVAANHTSNQRTGHITGTYHNQYVTREFVLTVKQNGEYYIEATYVVTADSQTVQFYTGGTNTYRDVIEVYDDQQTLLTTITARTGVASYTFTSPGTYKAKLYYTSDINASLTSGWGPVEDINYTITAMTVNVARVQSGTWNTGAYIKLKVLDFCDRTYYFGSNCFRNQAMTDIYFRYAGNTAFSFGSNAFSSSKTSSDLTIHYNPEMTEANLKKLKNLFTKATFVAIE